MNRGFLIVWEQREVFIKGFASTVILTVATTVIALMLGVIVAAMLRARILVVAKGSRLYIDAMRCVPFLLFAYLLYYGLPAFGVRLSPWNTGLLALIVYNTAYMAEIIRAAWSTLSPDWIEAGHAFGFRHFRLFRHIIFTPLSFAAAPMIGNQAMQIMKDSAFLMIITIPELTYAASYIQSTYFTPFAPFVTAFLLYWVLTMLFEGAVALVGRQAAARR
jgi:polar amino acid transport system permease protein